jgi:hypothetical protein
MSPLANRHESIELGTATRFEPPSDNSRMKDRPEVIRIGNGKWESRQEIRH